MDSLVDLLFLTGFLSALYTALAVLAALFEWAEVLLEGSRRRRTDRASRRRGGMRSIARDPAGVARFGQSRENATRRPMAARGVRRKPLGANAVEG